MENKTLEVFKDKKVLLGVCSSISVYKAVDLCSMLVKSGAQVSVVMTENATKLISPRIFQTISRNKCNTTMWDNIADWRPEHIAISDWADIFVVAPATANTIGNFANGLAPDMISSTFLATNAPVLIAPAMNDKMYCNPAVQKNIKTLREYGIRFVEPADGPLACGTSGKGRLADISEILESAAALLTEFSK